MNESQIFADALKMAAPAERAAFLDGACAGNPQLRAEIEALLLAHATDPGFLEQPAGSLGGMASVAASASTGELPSEPGGTDHPGVVLAGRYKFLEQIGEGGMGTVWMAQQTEPVKRLVAVKLIKAGMDSKQVAARFEAERQALAMMDHPNIARVLDGGTTTGEPSGVSPGRPYFVMDLVKGVPITKYCDEHHLTPGQRLELFVPVCHAIQHAHQKGIIHRDLKPSNVLVALYDGKPVPKVIDFGVAKAAGQSLTDKTLVTGFGTIVGTLEYMSPEQAEVNQLDIDTRSDIYSLGVLLYELLTGSPPFSRKDLEKAGMLEMLRVIREQEPSKPSTKLSSSDALPTLSANRGTEPAKLTKLVRGELDWIVMKALEKDRNRRYETANGFAMDLQRYLADEPVQACPPSSWYRLRKFVRRNKGPVIAVSVIVFCLLAGIIGTFAGLVWAMRERDDKAKALVAETKALEAEQKSRERADDGFAHAQQAVELFFNRVTEDPLLKQKDFSDLRKKLLKAAVPFYEWLKVQQQDSDKSRAAIGHAYQRLAFVRAETGEAEVAMEDYRHMQAIFARLAVDFPSHPEFRRDLATSHNNLGLLLRATGRMPETESAYGAALAIRKRLAADFPSRPEFREALARSQHNLGSLLKYTGRLNEAESAYGDARATFKQLAADFPARPEFRRELATAHNNLGILYQTTARLPEAESAYDAALAIQKQLAAEFPTRPEFRQDLARSHNNLGFLLRATGRLPEALSAYEAARGIFKQLAADFPTRLEFCRELAASHSNLGNLLRATGRLTEAELALAAALVIDKQLAADFPNQPDLRNALAGTFVNLALLSNQRRDFQAAKRYLEEAETHHQAALKASPRHPEYRKFYRNNLVALVHVNASLMDQPAAVQAAERIRDLGWDRPGDTYDAACCLSLCIPVVEKADALDATQRQAAMKFYADGSMSMLRDAVAAGFNDAEHMKQDKDLDALRDREDFRKLLAELPAKKK